MSIEDLTQEERVRLEWRIGWWLVAIIGKAAQCGHKRPLNTFRDYVQVVDSDDKVDRMAKEYLHDLFAKPWGKTTEEMLRKWFPDEAAFRAGSRR